MLVPSPAAKREGQVVYSALLVDFVETDAESSRRWTEWWLKPEARAGLQALKLLVAVAAS